MNKTTIISILAIVIIGGGMFLYSQNRDTQTSEAIPSTTTANETGNEVIVDTDSPTTITADTTRYQAYTPELAQQSDKRVVLFFHASWCPTCRVANQAFIDMQGKLPEDVLVLRADYDAERALKKQYGVTYQHTYVQIDSEGHEVAKWNGGDVDQLLSKLQ